MDPVSGEITRKYILNGVLELIEDGVVEAASQLTDVTFSKIDHLSSGIGTSRLISVTSDLKEIANYRGSLMALFGDPIQESMNAEDIFTYVIQAQRSDGDKWILTAYQGSSGFAIGGADEKELSHEIAYLLMQKLASMAPSDFERRDLHHTDSDETYIYGCLNGECYAE